jgi:alkaline phosphatase
VRGARADGRDLVAEWTSRPGRAFVWNSEQLASVDADAQVLGLFSPSHMAYENDRARDLGGEPSIAEMTAAAIERLARHDAGYVLMIESGRIDHAHHSGEAAQALSETVAFDEAVRTALEMTSREDTLIIVTADHSHVFTIAGYPQRGNPILGLAGTEAGPYRAADGLPYTTLGYANGPGAVFAPQTDGQPPAPVQRPDLTGVDTTAPNYRVQALVPMESETHAGEDVAIYAWGPADETVAGTLEQNMVFHIMARALGFEWSAAE